LTRRAHCRKTRRAVGQERCPVSFSVLDVLKRAGISIAMARRCDFTGRGVQAGNNVSHAHNKTRRRFLPNLQKNSLLSDALGQTIQVRLRTQAIRSIEKRGGLDAYLLSTPNAKLGKKARALKRRIKKALAGQAA